MPLAQTLWGKVFNLKCKQNDKPEDNFLKFDSFSREMEYHWSKIEKKMQLFAKDAVICYLLFQKSKIATQVLFQS